MRLKLFILPHVQKKHIICVTEGVLTGTKPTTSHQLSCKKRQGKMPKLTCIAWHLLVMRTCTVAENQRTCRTCCPLNNSHVCVKPKKHERARRHAHTHKPPHSMLFTVLQLVHYLPVFFFQRPCTAGYILWTHFESSFRNPVIRMLCFLLTVVWWLSIIPALKIPPTRSAAEPPAATGKADC